MNKMAKKEKKKKTRVQNLRKEIEDNYLKNLEDAVAGRNGTSPYIVPPEIKKRREEFQRRKGEHRISQGEPTSQKEPPRIPIERAIGNVEEPPVLVEEAEELSPATSGAITEEAPPPPPLKEPPLPPRSLPPAKKQVTTVPPQHIERPVSPLVHAEPLYDIGTIIRLEDGSIGVYKGPIPGKEYHLIYHLCPDGTIQPEGIYLYGYLSEPLGRVTLEVLGEMQQTMHWERDRIIYHLSSYEKARLIPLLSPSKKVAMPTEPLRKRNSLERGRRLRVKIGHRLWEAVYWGSDELGQIVAHNTNKIWTLMHLNLGRFGDSLETGDLLSPNEIKEINNSLSRTLTVGD